MSGRRFVVTGGPGSGKTTLIEALAAAGHATCGEAGRAIIREETAAGGTALPWLDPLAYAERMLARDLAAHAGAGEGPVFFDRGVPDIVGYLRLSGIAVPERFMAAARACRYERRVFIAPPWPDIYARDAERRQSPQEAERTFEAMARVYPELGYELVRLPLAPVAERLGFVLAAIEV